MPEEAIDNESRGCVEEDHGKGVETSKLGDFLLVVVCVERMGRDIVGLQFFSVMSAM